MSSLILKPSNANFTPVLPDEFIDSIYGSRAFDLTADGSVIAIGHDTYDSSLGNVGRVYIHERNGDSWDRVQTIDNPDAEKGENFGEEIKISADGSVLLITNNTDKSPRENSGAVYIYLRNAQGTYDYHQKLNPDYWSAYSILGFQLEMSYNGDTIFAATASEKAWGGSQYEEQNQGAIYIFTKNTDGNWVRTEKITRNNQLTEPNEEINIRVSCDKAGETLFIGTYATGPNREGVIYIYSLVGGVWQNTQTLDGANLSFDDGTVNELGEHLYRLDDTDTIVAQFNTSHYVDNDWKTRFGFLLLNFVGGAWEISNYHFFDDVYATDEIVNELSFSSSGSVILGRITGNGNHRLEVFVRSGTSWRRSHLMFEQTTFGGFAISDDQSIIVANRNYSNQAYSMFIYK